MQSRIPFRPSVFSALLIAALLAAAALIADTARADHFTGSGSNKDNNFGYGDASPFGVMCLTLGGARHGCIADNNYFVHVCDMREATVTTYVDGENGEKEKYKGCRTDHVAGGRPDDVTTDSEIPLRRPQLQHKPRVNPAMPRRLSKMPRGLRIQVHIHL